MNQIPEPIFHKNLKEINWQKIYVREYGVQYSEMAILCLSPKAIHHVPYPSVNHIIIPEGGNTAFYIDKSSWSKLVDSLNKEYTTHPDKLEKYEKQFIEDGENYLNLSQQISKMDLQIKSNKELLTYYIDYQDKLFRYSLFAWTGFILNNYVAERAVSILDKYLQRYNMQDQKQEIADSLFEPPKRAAALELQYEIENQNELSRQKFNDLYKRYNWLSCLDLHNKPWTQKEFKEAINAFKKTASTEKLPFSVYVKKLKINKDDLHYLYMAKQFVYIKDARDDYRRKGISFVLSFFAEIAKRMNITSYDISYVKSSEIIGFLENNIPIKKNILHERKKGFVMYLDTKSNIVCLEGNIIPKVLINFKFINKNNSIQEIKGTVASRGKTVGNVVIVHGVKDLAKVKLGCVLVAVATHPDYTIAMSRASAIVTNEGGITSHAAIVSREYGIPCIVGTQNATQILKDGDKVEVNAIEGWVKKI